MNTDIQTVMELMAIPGPSGQEGRISARIESALREMGVPADCFRHDTAHRRSAHGGEIGNLIVKFPGHGRGEYRMLSTHMDTVPHAVGSEPRLDGVRIVNAAAGKALGADARAGVAVLLAAARELCALKGEHCPVAMVFFVQEEIGLVGSGALDVALLGERLPDMAFNFDMEDAHTIAHAVVGTERIIIELEGVAAHTGHIEAGISCAVMFAEAVAELTREGWMGRITRESGWASSNIGTVQGGTGSNVTMPQLHALGECRSFDLAVRERVLSAWRKAFTDAVERANSAAVARGIKERASVRFSKGPEYRPYRLAEDAPVVLRAREAIQAAGLNPALFEHTGGMDTCNIVSKGIPAVGIGVGERNAHAVSEWMDIPHFLSACRIAALLATGAKP